MTNVQVANREANIRESELGEKKRSNLAQEKLKGREIRAKIYGDTVKGVGSAMKGLVSAANDVNWYKKFVNLLKAPSVVNFEYPLGTTNLVDRTGVGYVHAAASGICVLPLVDTLGSANDNIENAVNIASQQLWATIRENMGGSIPNSIERSDVMQYVIAVTSIYTCLSDVVRAYKAINTDWSTVNRYFNKSLVHAMGYNYDDLINHKAELLTFINACYDRLAGIPVPMNMDYFKRKVWYPSFIYSDEKVMKEKAQIYLFTPKYLYMYNHAAAVIKPSKWYKHTAIGNTFTLKTFNDIVGDLNTAINQLFDNTDVDIIVAMMRKAFSENLLGRGFGLAGTETLEISFNADVLNQISSATLGLFELDSDYLNIGQEQGNTGTLHQGPINTVSGIDYVNADDIETVSYQTNTVDSNLTDFTSISGHFLDEALVNVDADHVTPDQVLESSRLTSTFSILFQQGSTEYDITAKYNRYGTEILEYALIFTIKESAGSFSISHNTVINRFEVCGVANASQVAYLVNYVSILYSGLKQLTQFKYRPIVQACTRISGVTTATGWDGEHWIDCMNYAPISESMLGNLHRIALYSLWIPR